MKKLLAIVISMAMLVAMMPMGVFAETNCSGGESCSCEAMIGTTHYATLEAAIGTVENRNNEATRITLCKNAEIEAASNPDTWLLINNKDIIIDLNGHNINLQKNNYILVVNGSLELTGQGTVEEIYPQDAAITVIGGSSSQVTSDNYSVVKIGEDVTVRGYAGIDIRYFEADNTDNKWGQHAFGVNVEVNGTLVGVPRTNDDGSQDAGAGIEINGDIKDTTGDHLPKIKLNAGSTVTSGEEGGNGNGIYAAGYAEWTLAGNITADYAISAKSGKFDITGGTYTSTGEYANPAAAHNDRADNAGAALNLISNDSYAGEMDVTISGGTFISSNGNAVYEGKSSANGSKVKNLSITGGTFTGANNKKAIDITAKTDKKVISGGTFSDLSAVEYAKANAEITLAKDIEIDKSIRVVEPITINGGGHTVTLTYAGTTNATESTNAIFNDYSGNEGIVKSLTVNNLKMKMSAGSEKQGYAFVAGKGAEESFAILFVVG